MRITERKEKMTPDHVIHLQLETLTDYCVADVIKWPCWL